MKEYENCRLCPRRCGVDRSSARGRCGMGDKPMAARAALHFWEEPCISGKGGSGTVFFSGCGLGCVYCQNASISHKGYGKEISVSRLAEIFAELETVGAENINLVTPTHFVPSIIEALELRRPDVPVIYNCGGYETAETLDMLKGYIDIYLTDIKYFSDEYAVRYSSAPGYFSYAEAAALKMIDQVGAPAFEGDMLKKGVLIRHLVLPGLRRDSIEILRRLAVFPPHSFILSLMSQYTPAKSDRFPELERRVTTFEYNSVVDCAVDLGLTDGYIQDRRSAKSKYTPDFDLSGV